MQVDFDAIYGNQALCRTLGTRIADGSMAHAYLLEGPAGSGKQTFAFHLAAAICCTHPTRVPCGACNACKKIFARPVQSPDIYVLGLEDGDKVRSIGVEAIRTLKNDVYVLPNELNKKIYIIGHADSMTVQAQNALLKILEEPPETVLFFLLCETRTALLPTIRSRVQCLTMERFDDDTLRTLLLAHEASARALEKKDAVRLSQFVRLADGAYGRALFYLQASQKTLRDDARYDSYLAASEILSCIFSPQGMEDTALFGDAPRRSTRTDLGERLADAGNTREKLRGLLDMLCAALRDILVCTVDPKAHCMFYLSAVQPAAIGTRCSAKTLLGTYQTLSALRGRLDANPQVSLMQAELETVLYRLQSEQG